MNNNENVLSQTGFGRFSTLELFYTKPEIALLCYQKVKEHLNLSNNDFFIEPSAGTGEFIKLIKNDFPNNTAFDINPRQEYIKQINFLDVDLDEYVNYNKIHIIGNPPFGRQSSLAKKFIKKCIKYVDSISFILPNSFKKESMNKVFGSKFHLVYQFEIPHNSFYLVNNKDHNVPTIFQIWEKRLINRSFIPITEPIGYKYVSKSDNPDFSFRRVGINAGNIETNVEKSEQSHYFLKLDDSYLNKKNLLLQQLKNVNFDDNNTVGPKSIGKNELNIKYNPIFVSFA
jgi:hypothetical protein